MGSRRQKIFRSRVELISLHLLRGERNFDAGPEKFP